jgi:integrase/recombinase XerD
MELEKIDVHNSEQEYKTSLLKLKKDVSNKNFKLIIDFLEASAIGKTARKNASKKQTGVRTRSKYMYLLKVCANFFDKSLDEITQKDMERFVKALNENQLKRENKAKYSEQTKSNIKKTLIQFLRWKFGETAKYHDLTDWIETRFKKKETPSLTEEEIYTLIKNSKTIKQRFLIAFLFDAGCRIEEFLNIRLEDVIEVKGEVPYYKVVFKNEFSKTSGRTIGLFWKPTTDLLREWLELHPDKHNLKAQLYPSTYDGARVILYKIGNRVLKKRMYPHLLRHSSATYYASRLNRYQLCKRYGWSFSSNMPDRYIDRAGVEEEKVADEFKQEKLRDLTLENENIKEQIKSLRDSDKVVAKKLIQFLEVFEKNPKLAKQVAHLIPESQKKDLF